MTAEYRGGNSRSLAKKLDQSSHCVAILDQKATILFANSSLCRLAKVEATQLVGKQCFGNIGSDEEPLANLLSLLAPPANARQGQFAWRQLTTPPVFGSSISGQLFTPLLGDSGEVWLTIVYLGEWEQIKGQMLSVQGTPALGRRSEEQVLANLRSRWKTLAPFTPLIGESPAIDLAMTRAQLAIQNDCNVLISGAAQTGKQEVVEAIFARRLRLASTPVHSGRLFPIECGVVDAELLSGMLEVFSGRRLEGVPRGSQQLLLDNLQLLDLDCVEVLTDWYSSHQSTCSLAATLQTSHRPATNPLHSVTNEFSQRGGKWPKLLSILGQIDIHLPPLSERREDIAPLATQILSDFCSRQQKPQMRFSLDALDLLSAYTWRRNLIGLREAIESAVERAVLVPTLQVEHLPTAIRTFAGSAGQPNARVQPIEMDTVLLELETLMLKRALKLSPRNRAQVARLLGISRPRLLRRIEQLGLEPPQDATPQSPRPSS